MAVSTKVKGVLAAAAAVLALAVVATYGYVVMVASASNICEDEAGASEVDAREARRAQLRQEREERQQEWDRRERERDERWAEMEMEAEEAARRAAFEAEIAKAPPQKHRRVRRFRWESPGETRGRLWNVPHEETDEALLTAFLRVCIAEADGAPEDCIGIWQVVKNNRRRTCDRGSIRRITECDDNGETFLSALRRHQRHVLGYMPIRNARARWVSKLTTECDMPEGWPLSESLWDAQYGAKTCPQTVALGRHLIKGNLPPSVPGHRYSWLPGRPIAWGGRCETKRGACDDRMACARGLARIESDTLNAFWCRVGSRGCRSDPEPICQEMGYTQPPPTEGDAVVDSSHEQRGRDHSGREGVRSGSPGTDLGGPRDDLRREEEHLGAGASS